MIRTSIQWKLTFYAGLCMIVASGSIIAMSALSLRGNVARSVERSAEVEAMARARAVELKLSNAFEIARGLSVTFSGTQSDIGLDLGREPATAILESMVRDQQQFIGGFSAWEPDAFDGLDVAYESVVGHDDTGRFIPYIARAEDGATTLTALTGYGDPASHYGHVYDIAKAEKREVALIHDDGAQRSVTLAVPILADNEFFGVVGVDLKLGFLDAITDASDIFDGHATVHIRSANGSAIAASTDEASKGLLAAIDAGSPDSDGSTWRASNHLVAGATTTFGRGAEPWSLIIGVPHSYVASQANAMAMRLSLIGAAFGLGGLTLLWFVAASFVKPIRAIVDSVKITADGDLTQRVSDKRSDEIGELAKHFNVLLANFQKIIGEVNEATREVTSAAQEIAGNSEQMAAGLDSQQSQTQQVSAAIEEMSATVNEVARKSSDAANAAEKSGSEATEGGAIVAKTVEQMREIAQQVNSSASAVSELGAKSEQIGAIIDVINDIADQTNLLALNAAIEAARAGEHGRGFSVVADEVRKLAERTTQATNQVAGSIKEIQAGTTTAVAQIEAGTERVGQGVELAGSAGDALQRIVGASTNLGSMVQSIAAAAEQQSAASNDIARSVEKISSVTRESSEGAAMAAQAASQLTDRAQRLQTLVEQFRI